MLQELSRLMVLFSHHVSYHNNLVGFHEKSILLSLNTSKCDASFGCAYLFMIWFRAGVCCAQMLRTYFEKLETMVFETQGITERG